LKPKAILIGILSLVCLVFNSNAQQEDWPGLKGPYLGQKPPGMTPEIFGKGFVSTNHSENGLCVSMDGKELYSWTVPKNMGEFIKMTGSTPTVTIDGKYFFFNSYERADKLWSQKKMTYEDKIKQLDSPQSVGGIYWIDAKIIEALKPINLK